MSVCKIVLLLLCMLLMTACASNQYPTGFPKSSSFSVVRTMSCSFDTVKVCDGWAGESERAGNCVCAARLNY